MQMQRDMDGRRMRQGGKDVKGDGAIEQWRPWQR
jgi:hypothetical protein